MTDFMVMEAVALRVQQDKHKAQKDEERKEWRKDPKGFDALRQAAN